MPEQYQERRRVFAPGTDTKELRFTATVDEAARLRALVRDGDTSLSAMVVAALLSPKRAITTREKGELVAQIVAAREDLGRVKQALDESVDSGLLHLDRADAMVIALREMNVRLRALTEKLG